MTIDYNNPDLLFEHKLREYIETQRTRADATLTRHSENASVYINLDSSSKWCVSAYVKGQDVRGKAAMLTDAIDIFCTAVAATLKHDQLPARLPAPEHASDDE